MDWLALSNVYKHALVFLFVWFFGFFFWFVCFLGVFQISLKIGYLRQPSFTVPEAFSLDKPPGGSWSSSIRHLWSASRWPLQELVVF